jgi:hypothetical protein
MSRTVRILLGAVLVLGLAVLAVHQRLRVTFLGYEVRRLRAELESERARRHRLEIQRTLEATRRAATERAE